MDSFEWKKFLELVDLNKAILDKLRDIEDRLEILDVLIEENGKSISEDGKMLIKGFLRRIELRNEANHAARHL